MWLCCDNKTTINIVHNPVFHWQDTHIEIDRHLIKEELDDDIICIPFVKIRKQLADILTKGVSSKVFHTILSKLGMCNIFTSTSVKVEVKITVQQFCNYHLVYDKTGVKVTQINRKNFLPKINRL